MKARLLFFVASFLMTVGQTYAADTDKVEIRRFRFQKHGKNEFERLVMEFGGGKNTKAPTVKVTVNAAEKSANVQVDNLALVGAIPEAAINDSYASQSKYLGAININTDGGKSLALKTTLKDATVNVDAFWLENPARLVVDAFPPQSARAAGPAILGKGGSTTAKAPKTHKTKVAKKEAAPAKEVAGPMPPRAVAETEKKSDANDDSSKAKKGGKHQPQYFCFPTVSQVTTSVSYAKKGKMRIETDGTPMNPPTVNSPDGMACYPKSSQVNAVVLYRAVHPQPPAEIPAAAAPAPETSDAGKAAADGKAKESSNAPVSPSTEFVNNPSPINRDVSSAPAPAPVAADAKPAEDHKPTTAGATNVPN